MPDLEEKIRLSVSLTARTATTRPLRPSVRMSMRPLPPRLCARVEPSSLCTRYSFMGVRLPKPLSQAVKRSSVSSQTMPPTTSSLSARSMPMTPAALRPMTRASFSSKRIDMPVAVERSTWSAPLVTSTSTRRSPSFRPSAMMPALLTLRYSCSAVRFTWPLAVRKKRKSSRSSNLATGRHAQMRSSGRSSSRFCTARPLAVRAASGICHTFSLKTRPVFVKQSRSSWLELT